MRSPLFASSRHLIPALLAVIAVGVSQPSPSAAQKLLPSLSASQRLHPHSSAPPLSLSSLSSLSSPSAGSADFLSGARRKACLAADYAQTPLQFEQNRGQSPGPARFLCLNGAYQIAVTPDEILLGLTPGRATAGKSAARKKGNASASFHNSVLQMQLIGANPAPDMAGEEKLPGVVNYFRGSDPKKWQVGVPTYGKVRIKQVYSGIDLVYYGNQKQLEYDFVVAPQADASQVRLKFAGAQKVQIAANGDLLLRSCGGEARWQRPVVYQTINGRRQAVEARYDVKRERTGAVRVAFDLARYDHLRPLVIDPVLTVRYFNTLTGNGPGLAAPTNCSVVDNSGNSYTVGTLVGNSSLSPPTDTTLTYYAGGTTTLNGTAPSGTPGSAGISPNAQNDMFVTKLNSSGVMQYLTVVGGSGSDTGEGIAIDSAGSAYLCGATSSANLPVPNGYLTSRPGAASDLSGYLAKLNTSGTLIWGSYFGWSTTSEIFGISVDPAGNNIYIAGISSFGTASQSPVRNSAGQQTPPLTHGYNTDDQYFEDISGGSSIGFVARLQGSGSSYNTLVYGSIFEGNNDTSCFAVALDPQNSGTVYVTGSSDSSDVFVSHTSSGDGPGGSPARTYTTTIPGGAAGNGRKTLLLRVDTNQSGQASLPFGTYFGGSAEYNGGTGADSEGIGLAFAGSGSVWVAGYTNTTNLPTVNAAQSSYGGASSSANVMLFEMNTGTTGSGSLLYSTYLGGGNGETEAAAVDVDAAGAAYITGYTTSTTFPTRNPVTGGASNKGGGNGRDGFVAKIDPGQSGNNTLIYSTYLGTARDDTGLGVGVDASGSVYVTGSQAQTGTPSNLAPTVFFAKLNINAPPVANPQTVTTVQSAGVAVTLTASDANGDPLTYTIVSSPAHGSLSGTLPNLTYQPNAGFFGTDNFTFKANDGFEDSNTATIAINVIGRPTAINESVSPPFNTATLITLTGFDPNTPPRSLTYSVTTNPAHGTLSGTAPILTYTPNSGYHGADSFTFTINNGVSTSNVATVSLNVAVGTPTANNQSVTANQDTAVGVTLTGSDPDIPALSLTYSVTTNPAHGTLSGTAPNLTYTPIAGYFGSDSFQFKVNNGVKDSNTATVSITVNQTVADVSGQVQVTRGVFVYNRAQGVYSQQVTLTNTGSAVTGPISLILSSLANATLANATGTTSSILPAGRPYINTGSLAAGASITLTLQFTKSGTASITYSTQIVAGPGSR